MGCYDTIIVECPFCTWTNAIQTKSGRCNIRTYRAQNAPVPELAGALGDHPCENCKRTFTLRAMAIVRVDRKTDDEETEE